MEAKSKCKVIPPAVVKLHVVNRLAEHELTILIDHFSRYGWHMYYVPESDTSWSMTAKSYHTFIKHYYMFKPENDWKA